jgi:anti-anti-sigma factor
MRLKILREDDSFVHVGLVGRLDIQGVNEIQMEFLHQTTSLPRNAMVDLSELTYIASLGISMLVSAAKKLERNGAKMVLLHPTPLVRKALETSSLQEVIPIATAEAAAIAMLR